eukprot:scaffold179891_cov27-Tisochrysis_lutea.AAC.2
MGSAASSSKPAQPAADDEVQKLEQQLKPCGCAGYAAKMVASGWDDLELLHRMDEDGLKKVASDVGMTRRHADHFVKHFIGARAGATANDQVLELSKSDRESNVNHTMATPSTPELLPGEPEQERMSMTRLSNASVGSQPMDFDDQTTAITPQKLNLVEN